MTTAVVAGSIAAVAQSEGRALADVFTKTDVIVLIDVSGSMEDTDARGNKQRYAVACQELARLQAAFPGKIAVMAFSDDTQFVPGGVPPLIGSGTNLAGALRFARVADGLVRFVVISDGLPDSEDDAINEARTFKSVIDTIYCGPETGLGAAFLRRLASASHGACVTASIEQLATKTRFLLGGR